MISNRRNLSRPIPRRAIHTAGTLFACVVFTAAASARQETPPAASASRADSPCVQRKLIVSVLSGDSQPVSGLTASNFEARVDGRSVTVVSAAPNPHPPTVILLIDVSASAVRDASEMKAAIETAEFLLTALPPGAPVGLAIFNEKIQPIVSPTTDRQSARSKLELLRVDATRMKGGATAFYDSVAAAMDVFGPLTPGDVIYAFTDADDDASHLDAGDISKQLDSRGIRLLTGILFTQNLARIHRSQDEIVARQISQFSGGDSIELNAPGMGSGPTFSRPKDALTEDAMRQVHEISNFYELGLEFPSPIEKPRKLELKTLSLGKDQEKHIVLRYPQILLPCANPAARP